MILPWICAALAALGAGALGSFVLVRRLAWLAGGLAHTVFAGLGLCLWLQRACGMAWADPLVGAWVCGLLTAVVIGIAHIRFREREEALMSLLWSFGMALGLLFVFLTPGYVGDLHDFLFGSLVWSGKSEMLQIAALDTLVITLLYWQRHRLIAICFDEEIARIQGTPAGLYYIGLLMLIATAVVALIHTIGVILVLTLLIAPPMIAALWTRSFARMTIASALLGPLVTLTGCFLADVLEIPPSPAIALFASGLYFLCIPLRRRVVC